MKALLNLLTINENELAKDLEIKFSKIAKLLLNRYSIYNGINEYEFVEFEFYVVNPQHPDVKTNGERIVYPRKDKKAGQLMYHYNGIDICFENQSNKCYGGILIRAIQNINEDKTCGYGGPQVCKDEILNTATQLPKVISKKTITNYELCDFPTKRVGIANNSKYRYYRKSGNTSVKRERLSTDTNGLIKDKPIITTYNWAQNPK